MALFVLLVAVLLIGAGIAVRRNEQARRAAAAATVELDVGPLGVRRLLADGREEAVDWVEIVEVEVLTTAVGVHRADGVLIVLHGDGNRGCLIPSRSARDTELFDRLATLPGFDSRALVDAMQLPPPSQTVIWGPVGDG